MDPPLTKPISGTGSTSGMTFLRVEKLLCTSKFQPERGIKICDRNSSAGAKVSAEVAAGAAPGTEAEIPVQPVVETREAAVPLPPMEVNRGAEIQLQPVEDPTLEHRDAWRL